MFFFTLSSNFQMYAPLKLSIKSWAEGDRPREKLVNKGRSALSDAELIAILIGSGSRNESAVELSKRILNTIDNKLESLARLGINELKEFSGMGEAKALSIIAALELGRRRSSSIIDSDSMRIKSSNDAYCLFRSELDDLQQEEFWMLLLNRSNVVIKKVQVSRGGLSSTIVDPKVVFKIALSNMATGILLGHNHPSGLVNPSEEDRRLTKRLKEGANLLDLVILDHIIVGANTYFSFADEGLL